MIPNVSNVLKGETQIERIYKGFDLVWEHSKLPKGYTLCEYLESTGTQWIDTNLFIIPSLFKIDMQVMQRQQPNVNTAMFGVRYQSDSSDPNSINVFQSVNGRWRIDIADGATLEMPSSTKIKIYADLFKKIIEIGGVRRGSKNVGSSRLSLPFLLFTFATNGKFTFNHGIYCLYDCKMYENDKIVRDYIPCLDTNGRPCLYDTVSKQPYYNSGSDDFIVGYEDGNLFNENSPWALERACSAAEGTLGTSGSPRLTYFFRCKPNTKYRITADTWGDRLGIYGRNADWKEPPTATADKINTIYKGNATEVIGNTEFTTNSTDNFVWVYFNLNGRRPTGVVIKEVQ